MKQPSSKAIKQQNPSFGTLKLVGLVVAVAALGGVFVWNYSFATSINLAYKGFELKREQEQPSFSLTPEGLKKIGQIEVPSSISQDGPKITVSLDPNSVYDFTDGSKHTIVGHTIPAPTPVPLERKTISVKMESHYLESPAHAQANKQDFPYSKVELLNLAAAQNNIPKNLIVYETSSIVDVKPEYYGGNDYSSSATHDDNSATLYLYCAGESKFFDAKGSNITGSLIVTLKLVYRLA